jgi:predicted ATP-grasp superfamily ATP-dependent carboligase
MRLFICEFITGGGLQDKELPDALVREGNMMLEAVLIDLLDMGINDIITTRDDRLGALSLPIKQIAIGEDFYSTWQSCMNDVDAVLIIAPESEDVLFNLTLMAEQSDCYLLGCSSISVQTASSKLKTAKLLFKNKIPCIETSVLGDETVHESQNGWVIKPDDGVGAEDCYFCADIKALNKLKDSICIEKFVIQEYVSGISASLSMICYQGKAQLLACNKQVFRFNRDSSTAKGELKEIIVNGLTEQWSVFDTIAQDIARADKELWGYIGIDLIVTETGPVVVEINPRLTTSYVGLRESLALNPAELIVSIWQNGALPELNEKDFLPVNLLLEEANVV